MAAHLKRSGRFCVRSSEPLEKSTLLSQKRSSVSCGLQGAGAPASTRGSMDSGGPPRCAGSASRACHHSTVRGQPHVSQVRIPVIQPLFSPLQFNAFFSTFHDSPLSHSIFGVLMASRGTTRVTPGTAALAVRRCAQNKTQRHWPRSRVAGVARTSSNQSARRKQVGSGQAGADRGQPLAADAAK